MKAEQNRRRERSIGQSTRTLDHVAELQKRVVELITERFASAWDDYLQWRRTSGNGTLEPPDIPAFVEQAPPVMRRALLAELLRIEWDRRAELGQLVDAERLAARMPQYEAIVRAVCAEQWESSTRLGTVPEVVEAETRNFASTDALRGGLLSSLMPGDRVAEEYVAECCLESSTWKDTYTIRDPVADGRLVLKRFARPIGGDGAGGLQKKLQSADVRSRLGIRATGMDAGTVWLVREFVDATSVADHVRANDLSFKGVARLVAALAMATDDLHGVGVVHGNLKPSNVFVLPDETVQLVDPWIRCFPRDDETAIAVSAYAYSPPELLNDPERPRFSVQADVYSAGAILYELLVRRAPYPGRSFSEFLRQVRDREPRPLRMADPRIDPELERICLRALEKKPSRRFPTARALADALNEWAARPEASSGRKPRSGRVSATFPATGTGASEPAWSSSSRSASASASGATSWKTLVAAACVAAVTTVVVQHILAKIFEPASGGAGPQQIAPAVLGPPDETPRAPARSASSNAQVHPVRVFENRRNVINMHRIEEGGRTLFVHADQWTLLTFGQYSGVEESQSWELAILQLPPTGGWTFLFGIRPDPAQQGRFNGEGIALIRAGPQTWELRVRRLIFTRSRIIMTHDIFATAVTFEPSEPVRLRVSFDKDALSAVFFNDALLPELQQALESGTLQQRGFGAVSGAVGILATAASFRVTDVRVNGRDVLFKDASL